MILLSKGQSDHWIYLAFPGENLPWSRIKPKINRKSNEMCLPISGQQPGIESVIAWGHFQSNGA